MSNFQKMRSQGRKWIPILLGVGIAIYVKQAWVEWSDIQGYCVRTHVPTCEVTRNHCSGLVQGRNSRVPDECEVSCKDGRKIFAYYRYVKPGELARDKRAIESCIDEMTFIGFIPIRRAPKQASGGSS